MTIEELEEIAKRQLTNEEILVLKLSLSMSSQDIATKLYTSRQRVHKIVKRAKQKIEEQQGNL